MTIWENTSSFIAMCLASPPSLFVRFVVVGYLVDSCFAYRVLERTVSPGFFEIYPESLVEEVRARNAHNSRVNKKEI